MMETNVAYDPNVHFARLAQGDETAFRVIFDHFREIFFFAALKMTRSETISQEIVQETFVTAWEKRQLVAAARHPENYLLTILHNKIYNEFKKLARERTFKKNFRDQAQLSTQDEDQELIAKHHLEIIDRIVDQLPPQQKRVYFLCRIQKLPRKEVARQLGLSPATVKNHLADAKRFIARHYRATLSTLIWISITSSL